MKKDLKQQRYLTPEISEDVPYSLSDVLAGSNTETIVDDGEDITW